MKIVALSKFGFKLDSLKNDWLKCDRSLLNRSIFTSLQKGLELKDLSYNDKGFITSFSVGGMTSEVQAQQNHSPFLSPPKSFSHSGAELLKSPYDSSSNVPLPDIKASDIDRKILKGQCLNLVFSNICDVDDLRFEYRIKRAKELFDAIEKSGFYGW